MGPWAILYQKQTPTEQNEAEPLGCHMHRERMAPVIDQSA